MLDAYPDLELEDARSAEAGLCRRPTRESIVSSIGPNSPAYGRILCPTKAFGDRSCVAMAGGVNPAVRCQTWKFTTKSFAAIPAMTPTRT